jgi:hypothetical protein
VGFVKPKFTRGQGATPTLIGNPSKRSQSLVEPSNDATGRAIQVSGIALAIISAVQGVGTKLKTNFTMISTSLK